MSKNHFLAYDLTHKTLWHEGRSVDRYDYRTSSGERISFATSAQGLIWRVPFFITDNIFYIKVKDRLIFSKKIDDLRQFSHVDGHANVLLRRAGFLPHARTQYAGVSVVCSYLTYVASPSGVSVSSCFPYKGTAEKLSVDDLMFVFRRAFQRQLERVNRDSWVLPLSGGMDSRLLLSLALEHKDIELKLFTLGTRRSGDINLAKSIAERLGLSDRHKILYLEDLRLSDILDNYKACGYLLPLDRILTKPMGDFFKPAAVLSGLYGDVIFSDNTGEERCYSTYYQDEGFEIYDDVDREIVLEYGKMPRFAKLQRVALRCQKLTRQSFPINPGFDFVIPFVDPEVIMVSSQIKSSRIYPEIVSRYMQPELREFIHQSSLSFFTHPNWLRMAERKVFKLLRHPARLPYFDSAYLRTLAVTANDAPIPE